MQTFHSLPHAREASSPIRYEIKRLLSRKADSVVGDLDLDLFIYEDNVNVNTCGCQRMLTDVS